MPIGNHLILCFPPRKKKGAKSRCKASSHGAWTVWVHKFPLLAFGVHHWGIMDLTPFLPLTSFLHFTHFLPFGSESDPLDQSPKSPWWIKMPTNCLKLSKEIHTDQSALYSLYLSLVELWMKQLLCRKDRVVHVFYHVYIIERIIVDITLLALPNVAEVLTPADIYMSVLYLYSAMKGQENARKSGRIPSMLGPRLECKGVCSLQSLPSFIPMHVLTLHL